jgi:hypothetical protein
MDGAVKRYEKLSGNYTETMSACTQPHVDACGAGKTIANSARSMDFFVVEPAFQPLFERLGLRDCAKIIEFFSKDTTGPFKKTWIKAASLDSGATSESVFFKQYAFKNPSWKFFGRASKARREFENYAVLQQLKISCAQRVCCGEQRDWLGRLQRAFIITKAIPDTVTLLKFVREDCPERASVESAEMRRSIVEQLAAMTRRIHEAHFFHNDLFWRNVLVQWKPKPGEEPKLWWIDCPRGGFGFAWHRKRIKDLAALDISAEKLFSASERILFMKIYSGQEKLNAEVKRLIRSVLAYRKKRWRPR